MKPPSNGNWLCNKFNHATATHAPASTLRKPVRQCITAFSADGEGFDSVFVTGCADNGLPQSQIPGEAESEAVSAELAHLIAAWPTLSEADRAAVLAIIDRAEGGQP